MKKILRELSAAVQPDIEKFHLMYRDSLNSEVRLINTVINFISRRKGKQVRPILTLLAANICGTPTELTYRAAALVEMLHVATLIHDDVVDDADLRRGWPSVKRIWKNKLAILVGDYLFSKALSNMIHLRDFDALELLSTTAERLSQGEILQIEKAMKSNMSEEVYYRMVADKTASLISAACELGAITTTTDPERRTAMRIYGEKVGIAFQIKDDLFDIIGNAAGLGKPTGFDLKKNMLTLPLIHYFESLDESERVRLRRKLNNHAKRGDKAYLSKAIRESGSLDYTQEVIRRFSDEAREALHIFPDSPVKTALEAFIDFNLQRDF
ncbi:MAG: polyprenyl synthetase family protein [FCB group bacterium]|nr:polyprenyl synthetase family protein [FCB group bacterium]